MKKLFILFTFLGLLTSCNVTETIVFQEDGSGEFVSSFDMSEFMAKVKEMGPDSGKEGEKKKGKVMDTTMVFADMMENYKDSIASLSEDKKAVFEAVKNMYMTMKVNEDEGEMNLGIGMKFSSIDDLKDIQEKVRQAQSLNGENDQLEMFKKQSPLGSLTGGEDNVKYSMTDKGFSRTTIVAEKTEQEIEEFEALFKDDTDEGNKEFIQYFEESAYTVKLVFPKKVKSVSIEGAKISEDGKTVTYKTDWIDYIKNPNALDVEVTFDE